MFQAKLSGWKRFAASLALLPGLTVIGPETLRLSGTSQAQDAVNSRPAAVKPATNEDPHALVKKARDALNSGRVDMAFDLAQQATINGGNAKWGLFEDTPESVLKDVQRARARLDRQKAERLISEARALYERRVGGDEQRALNLDQARAKCVEALQLQGPSSMWYFGDRPESMIKDIDSARVKIKVAVRTMNPNPVSAQRSGPVATVAAVDAPSSAQPPRDDSRPPEPGRSGPAFDPAQRLLYSTPLPAETPQVGQNPALPLPVGQNSAPSAVPAEDVGLGGGTVVSKPQRQAPRPANQGASIALTPTMPDPVKPAMSMDNQAPLTTGPSVAASLPIPDANKLKTVELMQRAAALQTQHKYVDARLALLDAKKHNAVFGPDEDTPDSALQSLEASAQKFITSLCREAHDLMIKQTADGVAGAERKLVEAWAAADGMGLDVSQIDEHKVALGSIKARMSASTAPIPPALPAAPLNRADAAVVADPSAPVPLPIIDVNPAAPSLTPPNAVAGGGPKLDGAPPPPLIPTPPPAVEPKVAVAPAGDPGLELLKQARMELNNGQIDSAKKIAYEILRGDYSCTKEAEAFLRTCEAQDREIRMQTAQRSFEHGIEALQSHQYEQALSIFKLIDRSLLMPAKRKALADYMAVAQGALDKSNSIVQASTSPADPQKTGADNLVKQEEAMRELQFQKLRAEGLQLEANATARFGKGDTDGALQDLSSFVARVNAANIDVSKKILLNRPIESRIERLKVLKHQQDFLTKEAKGLKDFRSARTQESLQNDHRHEEVARLMKDFKRLIDEKKYQEANKYALMAKQVDPDDPSITAAIDLSQQLYRVDKVRKEGREREEFTFNNNGVGTFGPAADMENPMKFNKKYFDEQVRGRANGSAGFNSMRTRSAAEKKLEMELSSKLVDLDFNNTSLEDAIDYLQRYTGLNMMIDRQALRSENVPLSTPIKLNLKGLALKSALEAVLSGENLRFVVDKDVIRITTQRGAAGKLVLQTLPIADLVVSVQNYQQDPINDLNAQLKRSQETNRPNINGSGTSTTPFQPAQGLTSMMSTDAGTSSLNGPGTLRNIAGGSQSNGDWNRRSPSGTIEQSLIHLITSSVRPDTWEAMGGAGRIEYYPLGMALVINQTPDVIEEVNSLLEQLRRLQDLEIAIEVRMITLAESFYERMGLDFSMNINTHNKNALLDLAGSTASFSNLQNLQNVSAKVVGLQQPGVPTPDLNLPISSASFAQAIPPFGGYAPGADGGLSLGLAFLSDIQVQMFLDAAQGDRRTNVMQAPKLTMFNGQSASLSLQDQQFFLTGVTVTSIGGVLAFTPQNQPFPLGVTMNLQPVVSGDRRFVRMNIQQTMTNLASANVPLFPITTIVTPTFDGGVQGQPIPFTQYIQQPTFTTITVSTTVVVPDGGTVLLGGMKTLSEGRNEFGPPILSKIPYIDRLFRNVGYGRDSQSLMMMVTPRIVINREEQEKSTGVVEGAGEP